MELHSRRHGSRHRSTCRYSDASGTSTNSFKAPIPVITTTKVTVTVTSLQDPTKSDTATITINPVLDVGTGAPVNLVQQFVNAYFRNGFNNLVSIPPLGKVKTLGTGGYVQEFNDAARSGAKLALVTASPTSPGNDGTSVVQLTADLYSYYTTVGAGTAGLPLYDTLLCPPVDATNSCTWDIFDKSYALFAYHMALVNGQDFTIAIFRAAPVSSFIRNGLPVAASLAWDAPWMLSPVRSRRSLLHPPPRAPRTSRSPTSTGPSTPSRPGSIRTRSLP